MADILIYALHYEGAFNKNSLGAVSEGTKLAEVVKSRAEIRVVIVIRPLRQAAPFKNAASLEIYIAV